MGTDETLYKPIDPTCTRRTRVSCRFLSWKMNKIRIQLKQQTLWMLG